MKEKDNRLLSEERAQAIARLSTLESLREQARVGHRDAMVRAIEKMIESELRVIETIREHDAGDAPGR